MNEKELIKAKKWSVKGLCIGIVVLGFIVGCLLTINYMKSRNELDSAFWLGTVPSFMIITVLPCFVLSVLIYFMVAKTEMTITNKRVYGKAMFGKRVDLPVDSISAVGTSMLKGIAVATSSGRIKFLGISNRDEIHKVLSDLIVDRQEKPVSNTVVKQEVQQSSADELKKYKELFDQGIITQEEFDAKKKQLLGI